MDTYMGIGKLLKTVSGSLAAAFCMSVVLILLSALLLLKLQPDSGSIELMILAIYVLSCLTGGWISGKKAAGKKYLWGLVTGILYFLMLFAVSGMAEGRIQPELSSTLLALVLCGAGGMVGGMLA